jgi:hypothetical protein
VTTGASDQLRATVEARAQDTPYQVIPTPAGFDLRIDVAEARWHGLLAAAGRKKVVEHRVALDEKRRTMTMTDVDLEVHWGKGMRDSRTGLPWLEASDPTSRKRRGRIYEYEFSRTWGGLRGAIRGTSRGTSLPRSLTSSTARPMDRT